MSAKQPEYVELRFDVDPEQGFAAMCASVNLEGYTAVEMNRKGRKAVVTYKKNPPKK